MVFFVAVGWKFVQRYFGSGNDGVITVRNMAKQEAKSMFLDDITAETILEWLRTGKGKRILEAEAAIRKNRVDLRNGTVNHRGRQLPLLLAAVDVYFERKHVGIQSAKEMKRKRKVIDAIAAMLAMGADAEVTSELFYSGRRALDLAVERADVPLVNCFIHGGAKAGLLSGDTGMGILRLLVLTWASSKGVATTIERLLALRAEAAARTLQTADQRVDPVSVNMYLFSSTMRRAVLQGANITANDTWNATKDVHRTDGLAIETEIFETLLAEVVASEDLNFADVVATGAGGQNALHRLATADPVAVHALINAATSNGQFACRTVLEGLQAKDLKGRTPLHVAASFYGDSRAQPPPMFRTLILVAEKLTSSGGLHWVSSQDFLAKFGPDAYGKLPAEYLAPNKRRTPQAIAKPRPPASQTLAAMGGWYPGPSTSTPNGADSCDLRVLDAPADAEVLARLIVASEPFLLRGEALDYGFRKTWTRQRFLERHGGRQVRVAAGGFYPTSLNGTQENATFKELVVRGGVPTGDATHDSLGGARLFAFGSDLLHRFPELREDFDETPALLDGIEVYGQGVEVVNSEFSFGPPGSGASLHFHENAVNALAYGRKRWLLRAPDQAAYSRQPTAELLKHWRSLPQSSVKPMECTQQSGDVLFVPEHWTHATFNLAESIGVAYHFVIRGTTAQCARY